MTLHWLTIWIYCALLRIVLARVSERLQEVGDCLVWTGTLSEGAPLLERPLKARRGLAGSGVSCQIRVRQLMLELAGKSKPEEVGATGAAVCTCSTVGCLAHLAYKSRGDISRDALASMHAGARRLWCSKLAANHPRRKLTEEQVQQIRASNEVAAVFATRFGVTKATIHNVRKLHTYKSYTATPWGGLGA